MNYGKPAIMIVDNNDSFTYNLVQILRENGHRDFDIQTNKNINITAAERYDGFIFSPGPGIPAEAPSMAELLARYSGKKGFFGVCLGHQAIAEFFGMRLAKLNTPRHGVREKIKLTEPRDYIFNGIPDEFSAGLYHSWEVCPDNITGRSKTPLRVTATGTDGVIMAVAHEKFNIRGVQFHPESFMSDYGSLIVINWINSLNAIKTTRH
jgi:anthranilate synthase component 2